jgi:hypothetical protein
MRGGTAHRTEPKDNYVEKHSVQSNSDVNHLTAPD